MTHEKPPTLNTQADGGVDCACTRKAVSRSSDASPGVKAGRLRVATPMTNECCPREVGTSICSPVQESRTVDHEIPSATLRQSLTARKLRVRTRGINDLFQVDDASRTVRNTRDTTQASSAARLLQNPLRTTVVSKHGDDGISHTELGIHVALAPSDCGMSQIEQVASSAPDPDMSKWESTYCRLQPIAKDMRPRPPYQEAKINSTATAVADKAKRMRADFWSKTFEPTEA